MGWNRKNGDRKRGKCNGKRQRTKNNLKRRREDDREISIDSEEETI